MRESSLQSAIRAEASRRGCWLWRNNSGVLPDARGVPIRFGLGNDSSRINAKLKSSDLIGIAPDGRFLAIEVKRPGWIGPRTPRERAQAAFIKLVNDAGGIAAFVTTMEEFRRLIG